MYLDSNIEYLMKINRLKLADFGEMFDLSVAVVSSYARGNNNPKVETILKICDVFKISVDDFLKKDLSKSKTKIGLLGYEAKENPVIVLDVPHPKNEVQETEISYTEVSVEFKEKVLALLYQDNQIKTAVKQIVKNSL